MDCHQDTSDTGLESPKQTKNKHLFSKEYSKGLGAVNSPERNSKFYQIKDHNLKTLTGKSVPKPLPYYSPIASKVL